MLTNFWTKRVFLCSIELMKHCEWDFEHDISARHVLGWNSRGNKWL
jgi:hypothetical protein